MVLTMKGNKKDLAALNTSVDALLADLKVPGAPGDLQERLTALSSKMTARSKECKALDSKSHLDRGNEYPKKILDIRNRIANDIHEFTFYGSTSIEMLIKDMGQTVRSIDGKVDQVLANQDISEGVANMQHINVAGQVSPRNDLMQGCETPMMQVRVR
ncbi:hypothetical protein B0H11DRAFT_2116310 [Mycena galericulata]|nr:hypothetical protein B0H11DRAFT_2116310 [Mycena galericulata]